MYIYPQPYGTFYPALHTTHTMTFAVAKVLRRAMCLITALSCVHRLARSTGRGTGFYGG